ncbi:33879_t:CDS:2, partial [Racocetra persica]
VLLLKGLKDINIAHYSLTFHERITSQFSNRQSKPWHIATKLFRDNKTAAAGTPKLIHSLVFSHDNGKVYCLADDVMIEAEHELETILSKLKNLWVIKKDVKFEGFSYNIGDFMVRTIDVRHKGILVERDLGFRQGFVFRLSPLLGFNFRHYVEKVSHNNYKSRIRTLFNDHSQISSRPPKLLPYPQYRRVKRVPPFYKKKKFWIYSGGIGILFTVYYVNHLEVVPISNRRRFMDVTPKQEAKLAQQAYSEIMRRYRHNILPSWDHRTRFVRTVAQQIIRVSGME